MYNHNLIEKKWQKYWDEKQTYQFKEDRTKPKAYILDMFPYPSGQGLHVGHPKGYTATDVAARYKHFKGYSVLHPIGWDAFGLPAEQYAINTNNHPATFTKQNIDHFREQLKMLGFSYDYNKEVDTTDPKYYKWTQWIFTKLFEHGLAEIRDIDVNWCEKLGTVLSNEEVLNRDGKMVSERGEFPVVKKPMRQWVLKITKYAEKLLDGLNLIDWPESLKSIQRKWIGKSIGALINFKTTQNCDLQVFTTRPDTLFGATYLAIAPDHEDTYKFVTPENKEKCSQYIIDAKSKSELERKSDTKTQTGVFSGSYAFHPITNQKMPIYICDYILKDYATGSIMAVPAHDERDFKFATKYKLPIIKVIDVADNKLPYIGDGKHINSDFLNGLDNKEAKSKMIEYLVKNKLGKEHITYKMKDWLFSRQRYWGEPFPIIFDENNKPHLVKDLPLLLPPCEDYKPSNDGRSPLAKLTEWINVEIDGKHYVRETNTMPQWAGSCWYYLGYLLKKPDQSYLPLDSKEAYELFKYWLPVDLYVGGQEHAVLHLLYSRFWHRFLYDIKVVPTPEPFYRIVNQGMILGSNGEKMSKSRGNVINPDEIIKTHGADALRLYEMFMGPLGASLPWTEEGLNGVRKWLDRVYRLFETKINDLDNKTNTTLDYAYNLFIRNVSHNIEKGNLNVAISDMMVFINSCYSLEKLNKEYLHNFLIVLSCFAPHLAEELNSMLGYNDSIYNSVWPKFDETKLIKSEISIPVMINGKLRDVVLVDVNASENEIIEFVKKQPKVINAIGGKQIKKIIYIKNKIVNILA